MENQFKTPHRCQCSHCVEQPTSPIAELHQQINQLVVLLNEKDRRQLVGLLARQFGQGGVSRLAEITSLSRTTIIRGQQEIVAGNFADRVRSKGAGRPLTEKKHPDC